MHERVATVKYGAETIGYQLSGFKLTALIGHAKDTFMPWLIGTAWGMLQLCPSIVN